MINAFVWKHSHFFLHLRTIHDHILPGVLSSHLKPIKARLLLSKSYGQVCACYFPMVFCLKTIFLVIAYTQKHILFLVTYWSHFVGDRRRKICPIQMLNNYCITVSHEGSQDFG